MRCYQYEILLGDKSVSSSDWQDFLVALKRHHKMLQNWQILITLRDATIYYYLKTSVRLPASLGPKNFVLRLLPTPPDTIDAARSFARPYLNSWQDNFTDLCAKLQAKNLILHSLELNFCPRSITLGVAKLVYQKGDDVYLRQLALFAPATLLSIDFKAYRQFAYRKVPKYFSVTKLLPHLADNSAGASFAVETFPLSKLTFLSHDHYDFFKHSLVLGGSGSGKSKLLASLIEKVSHTNREQTRIVIIDPHDALKDDLVQIPNRTIVDFSNLASSVDLFASQIQNPAVNVELMLGTFKSLIGKEYNSRLERVLRYSIYLLLVAESFSFKNLRQLLLDLDFRNQILRQFDAVLPTHIAHFFLTDFNELKTKSYDLAFAPIIGFVDEMQMLPVFNTDEKLATTTEIIDRHFLSIFSLNRLTLGDNIARTIAALLMQQLFLYAENRAGHKQLTIIIDEVAVVEQPILSRFLSELRKYQVNVILAGQYFDQVSPSLRAAILANASNYYLFHVSRIDAELLTRSLNLKLTGEKTAEDRITALTDLKARECVLELTINGKPYPAVKAQTLDYDINKFAAVPAELANPSLADREVTPALSAQDFETDFLIDDDVDIGDLMRANTTSRKILS